MDDRTHKLLHARLAGEQAEHRLPSVAAGLTRDGELIWSAGYGAVCGVRPDVGTQYRAGSITKVFTAAAVLRLRDEGRVSLSDPIGNYVEAGAVAAMTVGALLSHSAGLRAETAGPWWERTPGMSLRDLTASSLGPDAARFRQGRRHHYSNVGYGLLGALVAAVRDRPWHEVISREILQPLGMSRTTTRPQAPHATGYAVHPHADVLLPEPEHDAGAMAPAGQLWTTIADLTAFARFLSGCAAGPLSPDTLAEMREPTVVSEQTGEPWSSAYGLGLQLWNGGGTRYYGHSGSMPGFVAMLRITDGPGADTAIVLCNSTAGFSRSLAGDLLAILAENEPYLPPEWTPAEVRDEVLALLGTWYWGPVPFTLRLRAGLLELARADGTAQTQRFRPDGETGWRGIDGYQAGEPLVSVPGPGGAAVALDIGSFIYTRAPYDPSAPVPGGVDADGWNADY